MISKSKQPAGPDKIGNTSSHFKFELLLLDDFPQRLKSVWEVVNINSSLPIFDHRPADLFVL